MIDLISVVVPQGHGQLSVWPDVGQWLALNRFVYRDLLLFAQLKGLYFVVPFKWQSEHFAGVFL